MKIKDFLDATPMQSVIALLVIGIGLPAIIFGTLSERTEGAIVGMILLIIGYYFGSSRGSAKKDKAIAALTEKKN